ncbi:MAG: hypothetical protein K940chlam2_00407 [Chlamydiae bacterium]|nr:hypothetical protein [Chlamydiota bacterium]
MNILTVAMWLLFGSLTAYLAQRRGKNPYLWFFIGMLLGIMGLLILIFMPKLRLKKAQKDPIPTVDVTPEPPKEKLWYYLDSDNKQFGPMAFEELMRAYHEATVGTETYVWNEDLEDWKHFKDFLGEESLTKKP